LTLLHRSPNQKGATWRPRLLISTLYFQNSKFGIFTRKGFGIYFASDFSELGSIVSFLPIDKILVNAPLGCDWDHTTAHATPGEAAGTA
jgi:hypothetical protein